MKKIILLFLAIIFSFHVFPQPAIQWQKCLGGTGFETVLSVKLTADGGYILAGPSDSNDGNVTGHHGPGPGYTDYWLVKLSCD